MILLLLLLAAVCEGGLQGGAPDTRCVFQGKSLECEIQGDDRMLFNCTVCPYSGTDNKACPARAGRHPRCNVNIGVCHYDCDTMIHCLQNHWLIFDKVSPLTNQTETSCKVVESQKLVKPKPVRDLTLTLINSSVIKVTFVKPEAPYREKELLFKYIVKYTSRNRKFSGQRKLRRRSDYQVEVTLGDLQPAENYSISVIARPKRNGYRSEVRTKWIEIPEDVPLSGPTIPEGAFTVYNHQIVLYLKEIPYEERRGRIQHYKVTIDQCGQQNITSRDQYWTVVNLTSCALGPFQVETSASTGAGWSEYPSVFHINPELYEAYRAQDVYKKNNELVWTFPRDKDIESFTVFSCYGTKDEYAPQIMKCKVPVVNVTVDARARSMPLEDREAPEMVCSLCEWHYGLSVNVGGFGAGITWNAPVKQVSELSSETNLQGIIIAIVLVSCVAFLGIVFVWWLARKKTFCEKISILLPKVPSDEISEDVYVTKSHNSKPDIEKLPIRYHRDSGNSSMTTLRHDNEETKRLTSTTEEDKDEQTEDTSCVWTSSQEEEGMWSTDTSAMSDYRQVAGSQEDSAVSPVMYSGSLYGCDSSVPETDKSDADHSISTSAPTSNISDLTSDRSAPSAHVPVSAIDKTVSTVSMSVPSHINSVATANLSAIIKNKSVSTNGTCPTISVASPAAVVPARTIESCASDPSVDPSVTTIDTSASTISSVVQDESSDLFVRRPASGENAIFLPNHCSINNDKLGNNQPEGSGKLYPPSLTSLPSGTLVSDTSAKILGCRTPINDDISRETDIRDEHVPSVKIKGSVELLGKDKSSHHCDADGSECSAGSYSEFHCDAI